MSQTHPYILTKSDKIFDAVEQGELEKLKTLALDPEVSLDWDYDEENSVFLEACSDNFPEAVRFLLDLEGKHVEYQGPPGKESWPLKTTESEEVARMLLEDPRTDVSTKDVNSNTPLCSHSESGHIDIVKLMLASGRFINFDFVNHSDETASMCALRKLKHASRPLEREVFEEIHQLLVDFERDPDGVRVGLQKELGWPSELYSARTYSLMVFLSDGYFSIKRDQMILANRTMGQMKDYIPKAKSEPEFRRWGKIFKREENKQ